MKNTTIVIESDLTPFHQETMLRMLLVLLTATHNFWTSKSVKRFAIGIDDMDFDQFREANNLDPI